MLDPIQGGETTVGEFVSKSRAVCAEANADQPFMCVDLVFISTLLEEGYGLKAKTPLKVMLELEASTSSNKTLTTILSFFFHAAVQKDRWSRNILGLGLCL